MDLTIKKDFINEENIFEYSDEGDEFQNGLRGIFVPDEQPLNFKVGYDVETYNEEINYLHHYGENHKRMFDKMLPYITHLKEKYPKMPPNKPILQANTPQARMLFNKILGINTKSNGRKRKRSSSSDESNYTEESVDAEVSHHNLQPMRNSEYPKLLNGSIIQLGPRKTYITKNQFDQINWSTAGAATRALLAIIFDTEILATHTLTGKPSPAFYGRERPPKNRLDDNKVKDIIECVSAKCPSATVREIRAAITTKCADASKKKRYLFKKIEMDLEEECSNDTGVESDNMSSELN